jgi:hypothetical protein
VELEDRYIEGRTLEADRGEEVSTHETTIDPQTPGIQVRLSDYEGDELLVFVDIVRKYTPDDMQTFIFEKDSLRVLGNEAVLQCWTCHTCRTVGIKEVWRQRSQDGVQDE